MHDLRPDVPDLGTILGVWAHPDDEAYLSAGIMAETVAGGRRALCVTATRGELGFPDDDPRSLEERAALRTAELAACLGHLGVTEHRWLDHPDGGCAEVDHEGPVSVLTDLIEDLRPDTVLTFGPDGGTYHDDHIAVSRWTTIAVRRAAHRARLLYSATTPEWNAQITAVIDPEHVMMSDDPLPATLYEDMVIATSLPEDLATRKSEALQLQESQIAPLVAMTTPETFRELVRWEFFREPTADDWPDD